MIWLWLLVTAPMTIAALWPSEVQGHHAILYGLPVVITEEGGICARNSLAHVALALLMDSVDDETRLPVFIQHGGYLSTIWHWMWGGYDE